MSILSIVLQGRCQVFGQEPPDVAVGPNPASTYHTADIDSVDMASGHLLLNIPIVVDHSQRGKLNFSYLVTDGDSGSWNSSCAPPGSGNGCKWTKGKYTATGLRFDAAGTMMAGQFNYNDGGVFLYVDWAGLAGGDLHYLAPFYNGLPSVEESIDGSGIQRIAGSNGLDTLINRDGVQFRKTLNGSQFGSVVEDPNGNEIVTSPVSPNTVAYFGTFGWPANSNTIDTLGRTWSWTQTTNFTGCPVTATYAAIWSTPGLNNSARVFKFCWSSVPISTHFGVVGYTEYNATASMLTGIVLPDLTAWRFDYSDGYGDVTKIYLPTGGTITYTWATIPESCAADLWGDPTGSRVVASRTLSDGTNSYTYTYRLSVAGASWGGFTVKDPLLNDVVYTPVRGCEEPIGQIKYYSGSASNGTLLKTVTNNYRLLSDTDDPYPLDINQYYGYPSFLLSTITTWPNGQVSQIQQTLDSGFSYYDINDQSQPRLVYASVYGLATSESHSDYYTGNPTSTPWLSSVSKNYLALSNSSYAVANILNLVSSETTFTAPANGNICAETDYGYDESTLDPSGITMQHVAAPNSVRGNLTSVKRQLFASPCSTATPSMAPLTTTYHVYDTGMKHTATDPNTNTTTYAYSPTFYGAYVTQTTMPSTPAPPNVANHIVSGNYDFNSGLLSSFTDQNNNTTNYTYDVMLRPTNATYPSPDGGQTNFYYPNTTTVEMKKQIDATRWTDSFVYYDGLGRESRSMSVNGETLPYDQVDTCYDANSRVGFKSYPYQGNGTSTAKVCSGAGDAFLYDPLNRVTQVTHSDNSTVLTSYAGRATSVQDEGNGTQRVQRISRADGLGRLASLCEVTSATLTVGISGSTAPTACGEDIAGTGFLTTYAYDTLGDLTSVAQGPLNARTFLYDSMSRLTKATNPESGTICYGTVSGGVCQQNGYDANGNLVTRTDARGITTTYAYDALNRLNSKNYSDGTLGAYYYYDQSSQGNPLGRLTGEGTWASAGFQTFDVFNYDKMGRVYGAQWQCTPYNCGMSTANWYLVSGYTHNLIGGMTGYNNGMGVSFTQSFNLAGRLTQVTSSWVDSQHPGTLISAAHYNASGALVSATLGNGVNEARSYDSRLRLNGITDGSLYTVTIPASGGFAPDSDILLANDSVNGNWTYGYDAFNRLTSASATGNAYTYAYDRFGNRWQQNGPHSSLPGFDANNHMVPGLGVTYDAAGNVTNDGTTAYSYDAENRIIQAVNTASGTSTYAYDAEGRRVQKTSGGLTQNYIYDLAGHEIARSDSGSGFARGEVYAGGRHLATYNNSTTYFPFADWLGTERARSTSTGTSYETCTSLPFGDWLTCTGGDPSPMHLTGKERDSESGLDNFGARYDSSQYGRFMTPDPGNAGSADIDPQSWNAYAYARNNSFLYVDPDGLRYRVCTVEGRCTEVSDDDFNSDFRNAQNVHLDGNQISIQDTNGSFNREGTFQQTSIDDAVGSLAGALPLAGQMAAPGVNLAANGLMLFGNVVAPGMMTAAQCLAGSCSKGDVALAMLPEVAALREGGTLLKEGAAIGKGAEIIEKGGGLARATEDYTSLKGAEKVYGETRVKTLSDGSKAVLYTSSSGGQPSLAIQDAAGRTVSKYRY